MSNDKNNKINIFEDRDTLIRIWEKERDTRNFNVTLMWENVKYFSGIIGALLVVHTALLSLISSQNYGVFPLDLREAVLVFPIAVIVL